MSVWSIFQPSDSIANSRHLQLDATHLSNVEAAAAFNAALATL
ncbi:MAG: hypothetical protein WC314_25615 [Vulcanimicrobiota bacterium]